MTNPRSAEEILEGIRRRREQRYNQTHTNEPINANGSAGAIKTSPQTDWPTLDEVAFHGLAGDVVRTIEPHSEADPIAILVQFIAAFGNAVGRSPFYQVEASRHYGNLFTVLCGDSAKSRKGTSWGRVLQIMQHADRTWTETRALSGLSSGEGLIHEVRDQRKEWDKKNKVDVIVDAGVTDKRLLTVEEEFAKLITTASRSGNILSKTLCEAWDKNRLGSMTRNSPLRATGAHISIIGHITVDELRSVLTGVDLVNGFANRFMFFMVRRSKLLAFGGDPIDEAATRLGNRIYSRLVEARQTTRVGWATPAANAWQQIYEELSNTKPGMVGAATARGEAQSVRLALLYALLDGAKLIDLPHLKSALAVWRYAEASALYIFGDILGNPIADEILAALKMAGPDGISRTDINKLFGGNIAMGRIIPALTLLQKFGKARNELREPISGKGRPAEVWVLI